VKIDFGMAAALLFCALFLALGTLLLADIGLETDEGLFAAALYPPPLNRDFTIRVFRHQLPLMVMTYVGATKAWLYAPILALIPPSAFLVRFVALLIGAGTLLLFYWFVRKILGNPPAIAAIALLSTDPMFLLTIKWDWGPVAIQHFCLVSACLLLTIYYETRAPRHLWFGFFLLGIGLWDKALFAWSIAGLTVAAATVCHQEMRSAINRQAVGVALTAFVVGCFPLLLYNVKHKFVTFTSNADWSFGGIADKAELVKVTLEGRALYGVITREPGPDPIRQPETITQRIIVQLDEAVASPRKGLQWYAFILGVALSPLLLRHQRRVVAFALVFLLITWSMMALTKNAGNGAHHTILLWPMPQIVIVSVVALAMRWRYLIGLIASASFVTVIAIGNILALNTYYADEIRNGGTVPWTDAFYAVSLDLSARRPEAVYLLDWGFFDNLRLLQKGRIDLRTFLEPKTLEERKHATADVKNPNILYVTHTEGNVFFENDVKRFIAFAAQEGYRKEVLRTFSDRNGRPIIEMFGLVSQPH
jgi:4-amino-4-deoxy-L-arabinose transferase-like glycosyltransferase